MADISMADTGPDRRAGVKANGFGFVIAIATIVLTVVGTNVAVGAFLWLALDARMDQIDARMTSLETGMAELKTDIRELRDEARATNTRLSRIEGVLGIVGPVTPGPAAVAQWRCETVSPAPVIPLRGVRNPRYCFVVSGVIATQTGKGMA